MASSKAKQAKAETTTKEKGKQADNKRVKNGDKTSSMGNKSLMGKTSLAVSTMIVMLSFYVFRSPLTSLFTDTEVTLASAQVTHDKLRFSVPCSADYKDEQFTECKPKQCGRAVTDSLVSQEDAEYLLRVAKRGLSLGGSRGGASILDLHSGALSMGDSFVNIYKIAESPFSEEDFKVYRKVKDHIHRAIAEEFEIPVGKLFLTKPTFFSRMDTTPPHTIHDEYWHKHVDKETYGSFHYTSLLYLTTYAQDFQGGRFVFMDEDGKNRTVEPRLGRVSFFTSGSENPHFVERLTEGVRYAITVSFTCDPKQAIADPTLK
ncbi:2-oxoglutarate and iron-dependent oxygenase domain-containing protein 3-like [Babylonia areolata]|uniref:2-oxoglutarate and iron-dependent oxygenase domain-containing protein 3-like n=1 Tax=Babylonia areolata TaxID=304850 RepID=UPI003FD3C848